MKKKILSILCFSILCISAICGGVANFNVKQNDLAKDKLQIDNSVYASVHNFKGTDYNMEVCNSQYDNLQNFTPASQVNNLPLPQNAGEQTVNLKSNLAFFKFEDDKTDLQGFLPNATYKNNLISDWEATVEDWMNKDATDGANELSMQDYYSTLSNGKMQISAQVASAPNQLFLTLPISKTYFLPYMCGKYSEPLYDTETYSVNPNGYFEYEWVISNNPIENFLNPNYYNSTHKCHVYDCTKKNVHDENPNDGICCSCYANSHRASNEYIVEGFQRYFKEFWLISIISTGMQQYFDVNGVDANADGYLDAMSFYYSPGDIKVKSNLKNKYHIDWSDLLWPHNLPAQGYVNYFNTISNQGWRIILKQRAINDAIIGSIADGLGILGNGVGQTGKKIGTYNLMKFMIGTNANNQNVIGHIGTACHEMGHLIGFPDYYLYRKSQLAPSWQDDPLGKWSLMCSNRNDYPQFMLGYDRKKIGWLNETNIPKINNSGNYTLAPVSGNDSSKIAGYYLNNSTGAHPNQSFYLEYRSVAGNNYDASSDAQGRGGGVPGSGLIVYLVDEGFTGAGGFVGSVSTGNYLAPPYNAYVMRKPSADVNTSMLDVGDTLGGGNNEIFYQRYTSGEQGKITSCTFENAGIVISVTAKTNSEITFNVKWNGVLEDAPPPVEISPEVTLAELGNNQQLYNTLIAHLATGTTILRKNSLESIVSLKLPNINLTDLGFLNKFTLTALKSIDVSGNNLGTGDFSVTNSALTAISGLEFVLLINNKISPQIMNGYIGNTKYIFGWQNTQTFVNQYIIKATPDISFNCFFDEAMPYAISQIKITFLHNGIAQNFGTLTSKTISSHGNWTLSFAGIAGGYFADFATNCINLFVFNINLSTNVQGLLFENGKIVYERSFGSSSTVILKNLVSVIGLTSTDSQNILKKITCELSDLSGQIELNLSEIISSSFDFNVKIDGLSKMTLTQAYVVKDTKNPVVNFVNQNITVERGSDFVVNSLNLGLSFMDNEQSVQYSYSNQAYLSTGTFSINVYYAKKNTDTQMYEADYNQGVQIFSTANLAEYAVEVKAMDHSSNQGVGVAFLFVISKSNIETIINNQVLVNALHTALNVPVIGETSANGIKYVDLSKSAITSISGLSHIVFDAGTVINLSNNNLSESKELTDFLNSNGGNKVSLIYAFYNKLNIGSQTISKVCTGFQNLDNNIIFFEGNENNIQGNSDFSNYFELKFFHEATTSNNAGLVYGKYGIYNLNYVAKPALQILTGGSVVAQTICATQNVRYVLAELNEPNINSEVFEKNLPLTTIKYTGVTNPTYTFVRNPYNLNKLGEVNVEYNVKDGNKVLLTLYQKVIVSDSIAPSVLITGQNNIVLYKGELYTEDGVSTADNFETQNNSISFSTGSGTYNNGGLKVVKNILFNNKTQVEEITSQSLTGEYKITYTSTDSSGNTTFVERRISIIAMPATVVKITISKPISEFKEGEVIIFTAVPNNNNSNLEYSWFVDGIAQIGERNATFMLDYHPEKKQEVKVQVVSSGKPQMIGGPPTRIMCENIFKVQTDANLNITNYILYGVGGTIGLMFIILIIYSIVKRKKRFF
ncbi:MAG: hypothetical protein RR140_00300 [Clostridia bacterium]